MQIATSLIVLSTLGFSLQGFRREHFMRRMLFEPRQILAGKEWYRLLSSGLVHLDWMHLLMNLISLVIFGQLLEAIEGPVFLCLVYFSAVLGGNLLALAVHRLHEYQAVGASGGVCGLIFACLHVCPGIWITESFIPLPGWLYAILFILGSYYALRRQADHIGHDAHLGGALVGLTVAVLLRPASISQTWWLLLIIYGLGGAIVWRLATGRLLFPEHGFFSGSEETTGGARHREYEYNRMRKLERETVDALLDKIAKSGIQSLSRHEREILDAYSRNKSR
jgi:membrane associated rhomboid family serine protease